MFTKYFLTIICFFFFIQMKAQQRPDTTYQKQWKEINQLINKKNLPKSALGKVKLLYKKAKQEDNSSQIIKTLLYQISLNEKVDDDNEKTDIIFLTKELTTTKNETVQALLNLMLADAYTNAFNNDNWIYTQRIETKGYQSNNYKTWTKKDFENKVFDLLKKSLSNKKQLQQTTITGVDAIVLKGEEPQLRPTLYDLMAFDAISISENFIETSSNFTEKLLSNYTNFSKEDFSTVSDNKHFTLILYTFQELIKFHAKDIEQDALIDADINRVEWINNHFSNVLENTFINAIQQIINYGKNNLAADEAHFILAHHHFTKGEKYDFKEDTTNRYEIVEAKKIIDERLKNQPKKSSGNIHLQNLNKQIMASSLNAKLEAVNVPNEPFRMRLEYKNVAVLYYRIINANKLNEDEDYDENYWKKMRKVKPIKEVIQNLPSVNDYQTHATEIKIEALPLGNYIIFGSNSKDFLDSTSHLFTAYCSISNLSCINTGKDYFVLHRTTGQPIANATIQLSERIYELKKKPIENILQKIITDKNGYAKLDIKTDKNNITLFKKLIFEKDSLNVGSEYYYNYQRTNQNTNDEEKYQAQFFTDRSIYRPGQTLYFKALLTNYNLNTATYNLYIPKKKITVVLRDANDKEMDSIQLKANEFGSINGTFKLPTNTLTGNFSLQIRDINSSQKYFSVEEYKRPTFFIEVEKIKQTIRLNDTIKLKGFAKAYAGNASNNANVKYTVTRNKQYRWWRYDKYRNEEEKIIATGEIKTKDDGSFEITFKAEADALVKPQKEDEYSFKVNISVTDLNGETRDKTESFTIGYKALKIESNIEEIYEAQQFQNFTVTTQNMFDEKQAAEVTVKISALQTPTRAIRKRLWDEVDMFTMSEQEYIAYFPFDEYNNETDFTTWKKINTVFETTIQTDKQDTVTLKNQLPQGAYVIELTTKDKFGEEVKQTKYTELYSTSTNTFTQPQFNWYDIAQTELKPNDTAKIVIGSSFNNVFVIKNVQTKKTNNTEKNSFNFSTINNQKQTWQYIVNETDKSGFAMNYAFVKHNRFYTAGDNFSVPFLDKNLQIELASFRNKTEPNSKETWSVKIKTLNNNKAEAELLTAMYDASLNQFREHSWDLPNFWKSNYGFNNHWSSANNFTTSNARENYFNEIDYKTEVNKYSSLAKNGDALWWLNPLDYNNGNASNSNGLYRIKTKSKEGMAFFAGGRGDMNKAVAMSYSTNFMGVRENSSLEKEEDYNKTFTPSSSPNSKPQTPPILPRKNLQETAFFIPNIYADKEGNYTFSFTMPEALTQWRWMNFAHTKNLAIGYNEATIVNQKKLMVQPNIPRFVREGDQMELITKVANLTDAEITGECTLQLIDATNGNVVDGLFQNNFAVQYFTAAAQKNTVVKFPVQIPYNFTNPISIKIVAVSSAKTEVAFSDGEENTIPVLTNRTLVTETLPLYIKPNEQQKNFTFTKLLTSNSETLQHQSLTVEYTSNPIWNVVKSLPYLMEYPYECAEQTFNRFFANALASKIVNQHPAIKNVFDNWMMDSSSNKLSSLQQNEELKQAMLQETPWVLDAENEAQQQKNIALLFDVAQMSKSKQTAIEKLKQMQLPSGGFAWFKGGRENRFMTNYIVTGIGKLIKLGAIENDENINNLLAKATKYLDEEMQDEYNSLKKSKIDLQKNNLHSSAIEYLYMKSFFANSNKNSEAFNYYYSQAKKYWNKQNSYYAALIGFVLYRNNEQNFVQKNILPSIIENTVVDTVYGTIKWKNQQTCFWYKAPFEHQSTMIEFLNEVMTDQKNEGIAQQIDAAKTWLILNKQTNHWQTTMATAEACYALLSTGTNWLKNNNSVSVKLGNTILQTNQTQSSTGYFKQKIEAEKIQPSLGNVQITVNSPNNQTNPSYGAVFWQYFEDLDKITVSDSTEPLHLTKKIFKEKNTATGKILEIVNENDELKVGDKIVVRIELTTNRSMEYLHLKDMRASGSEPVNVLSGYKWQNNLGYYESTKDVSSNFFIDRVEKGTYVFEYPVYITHIGNFSVGIATIQCMYAPEFTSNSEGIKIRVTE